MRSYIVPLVLSLLAWTYAEEELYPDKYDYIDIDAILVNDRLRDQYYDCFMDLGPCVTADAIFFKEYIPDAIATKCKRCTEMQKQKFDTIAEWYNKNQPEKWEKFVVKMLEEQKKLQAGKE